MIANRNLSAVECDLERIENRYDPDHDIENDLIPNGPYVTWAEMDLANAVLTLIEHIKELKEQLDLLRHGGK